VEERRYSLSSFGEREQNPRDGKQATSKEREGKLLITSTKNL